jgi:hypothetical protein
MRKLLIMVGVLALVASVAAIAAETGGKSAEVSAKVKSELAKIDARLKLTAEQKTQIRTFLGEESDKLDALYKEIEPREKAITTEYKGKIRGVLNPTQQAEWDKIKGEYREKWEGKSASAKSTAPAKTSGSK